MDRKHKQLVKKGVRMENDPCPSDLASIHLFLGQLLLFPGGATILEKI